MFSIVRDPCIFYPAFAPFSFVPFTFVALPFVNDSCTTVDVCFGHAQLVDCIQIECMYFFACWRITPRAKRIWVGKDKRHLIRPLRFAHVSGGMRISLMFFHHGIDCLHFVIYFKSCRFVTYIELEDRCYLIHGDGGEAFGGDRHKPSREIERGKHSRILGADFGGGLFGLQVPINTNITGWEL